MIYSKSLLAITKAFFFVTIGIMIVTNPSKVKYEQYADRALNSYLKDRVCQEIKEVLTNPCGILVELARPQLAMAIAKETQRKNFVIFSIYQTDLSIPSILPEYQFETVAILDYFYTYQADRLD